jgi:uroporphyrin-III C-methyltransferase
MPANVDWSAVAKASPVLVMYMAVKNADEIARALIAGGRDPGDTLTFVSNATLPHQSILSTTLGEVEAFLQDNTPPTPALLVVGKVNRWREILDWYHARERENPIG